jgi:hypothetical protein
MQSTFLYKQCGLPLLLFIGSMLFASFKAYGPIILGDEPIPFKPNAYYIAGVTDERADKAPMAQLVTRGDANKTAIEKADLQGGMAASVGDFLDHNLPKDKSLRPVMMSIKEFKLTETALPDGSIDGRVKLYLSFGIPKDYGEDHLVDYHGGLHYIRNLSNMATIGPQLRSILKNGLVYFNDWMKANADVNGKLANKVTFNFTDYTEHPEGDTIYYSAARPLTWADFQSRVKPAGIMQAEVMPGFGYNQEAEAIKGIIRVHLSLKTFLPKSACWANYNGRDAYELNHEQRHFDIVKIITEQFKQKILAAHLTPDTFEAFINMQYLDSYRDMDAMQKTYDHETGHGTNHFAQAEWNERIDKELKKFNELE